MPKAKKKNQNPVEVFNELIRDSAMDITKGFETFFDDIAEGAERLLVSPNKENKKSKNP